MDSQTKTLPTKFSSETRSLFNLIIKHHNPVDVSLEARHPQTLGYLPKSSREAIESNIDRQIGRVLDKGITQEMKIKLAEEMANQSYYGAKGFDLTHHLTTKEKKYSTEVNNKKHQMDETMMKAFNDLALNYISNSVAKEDLLESVKVTLFDAIVDGDIDYIQIFFPGGSIFEIVGSIIMTEIDKLPSEHIDIVKNIFIHANTFVEYRNRRIEQQRLIKEAKDKGDKMTISRNELITPKLEEEKYTEIRDLIKSQYDLLMSDRTVHAPNVKRRPAKPGGKSPADAARH